MALILLVARRVEAGITLLILGIMFGYGTNAVVSLLLYFAIPERIQAYINWTFGSFGSVTWNQMKVFGPAILLGLAVAHVIAKPLNALLLGEAYARSMGLDVKRARLWIIGSTATLAGAVTAFCGPIGFLGIAVALMARNEPLAVFPAALLFGLLSESGLLVNTLLPRELIDVLTGAILLVFIVVERVRVRGVRRLREQGI